MNFSIVGVIYQLMNKTYGNLSHSDRKSDINLGINVIVDFFDREIIIRQFLVTSLKERLVF